MAKKDNKITITEFVKNWPHVIARVQYGGEAFTITRYGRVAARVVPITARHESKRKSA
jgi:antitoxin (DNA-binding transcriptional repressor) of toxin-antitoxin stability system